MLAHGMLLVLYLTCHALAASAGVNYTYNGGRRRCTVLANGGQVDDVPNIQRAFHWCGNLGTVVFPEDQKYWIGQKFNPIGYDLKIEWRGQFVLSDDMAYWRQPGNTYPIAFQNHAAAFVISGEKIDIDGYGSGGIFGNGDKWYTAEYGNVAPGRPMPFVFWNVNDVSVKNFYVRDPPLWSINIMNGTNMIFDNIYVNATSTQQPPGANWDINTDGFDTMDVNNIRLTNFVYQGGDDCIAIKPRSYNVYAENITCYARNGPAIGSLGQYLEDASVKNIQFTNVKVYPNRGVLSTPAYIKTWVGVPVPQTSQPYESDYQPRGGGWGSVRNIAFINFTVQGADSGPFITQDYGDDGRHNGTSLMDVSNVEFTNFQGTLSAAASYTASVTCSKTNPCYNVDFKGLSLRGPAVTASTSSNTRKSGKCVNVAQGGVHGLSGCV